MTPSNPIPRFLARLGLAAEIAAACQFSLLGSELLATCNNNATARKLIRDYLMRLMEAANESQVIKRVTILGRDVRGGQRWSFEVEPIAPAKQVTTPAMSRLPLLLAEAKELCEYVVRMSKLSIGSQGKLIIDCPAYDLAMALFRELDSFPGLKHIQKLESGKIETTRIEVQAAGVTYFACTAINCQPTREPTTMSDDLLEIPQQPLVQVPTISEWDLFKEVAQFEGPAGVLLFWPDLGLLNNERIELSSDVLPNEWVRHNHVGDHIEDELRKYKSRLLREGHLKNYSYATKKHVKMTVDARLAMYRGDLIRIVKTIEVVHR